MPAVHRPEAAAPHAVHGDATSTGNASGVVSTKPYAGDIPGEVSRFNHYREQVIFGASLLYDETQASFDWVFSTFLEAHNFKKPTTLFTDQDIAMGNAISVVMPEVRHGLCTFHIMQNAIKHLGNLMKDDSCFLSDFKALMFEYEDVTKFEKEWEALLKKYKVHGHSWLERTYTLKEKWARCYMKTTVTLGMRSTQLSESMNAKLKKSLKSKLDIPTFFKLFAMVESDKRYREVEAEYNAKEKMPRVKVSCLPLLKQAGKVYTPKIFELFQRQWEKSLLALVGNKQERGRLQEYLIVSCDEEGEYVVTHDEENATLSCSCNKFETVGILCGHALKVLDVLGIKYIPETYILKRWTRGARDGCALDEDGLDVHRSGALDVSDRYRELWPDAAGLDDTLLSSLSRGSNRAQFNGKKVMGEFNMLVVSGYEVVECPKWEKYLVLENVPSNVDILYAEGITSSNGLACVDFTFQLIRVQARGFGENCKWLEMFEDVRIVIFCVSLSDYDQFDVDGDGTLENKMILSRKFFESIVTHPTYDQLDFLLVLNKFDLFEEKIEQAQPDSNILPVNNSRSPRAARLLSSISLNQSWRTESKLPRASDLYSVTSFIMHERLENFLTAASSTNFSNKNVKFRLPN
ncbi:hypothetical protein RJ640_019408 [Escallonia rubra]|uniref:Protein FAR1-RELATED SEQUENCE n=1 Tax=Escallonia rubra TaxID=112253 RepID=A0AA88RAD4_9ASTE|nr:hypothetical protein RJ640_019408 [Escallonia rubra]